MWARWDRLAPFGLALLGCGGSSVEHGSAGDDDPPGGSGGTSSAGASSGGTSTAGASPGGGTAAGAGGAAGSMAGGAGTGAGGIVIGGMGGGSGAGGTAGTPEPEHPFLACLSPRPNGPCMAAFQRYAFNPTTLECEEFIYGGCGEGENLFETLEACQSTCEAALPKDCTPESRGPGCPCGPGVGECARTNCSSAPYELEFICVPWESRLCSRGGAKGGCWCNADTGDEGCGV